jgi:hypothetical protein
MKTPVATCCLLAALPIAAAAQTAPQSGTPAAPSQVIVMTMTGTVVQEYSHVKELLMKTADLMPADAYAFQPTPDVRTFAGTMGHILMSNISQCGQLLGRKHALAGQDLSKTLTTKADVVKAAAETFAFCDEFFTKIDESTPLADDFVNMNGRRNGQPVTFKVSNGASVVHFLDHNNEEYGYLAVYLRLKGVVPPSSAPAPGRGGGAGGGR